MIVDRSRIKTIQINGVSVDCLIDTGSDVTLIKKNVLEKINNVEIHETASTLRGLGNIATKPIGFFVARVTIDKLQTDHQFLIVSNDKMDYDVLLGFDFTKKFRFSADENGFTFSERGKEQASVDVFYGDVYNVVEVPGSVTAPLQYKKDVEQLIKVCSQQPVELKQCSVELKIVPDGVIKPFRQSPSRLAAAEAKAVKIQVEEWLQQGIVRESSSNVASRVVVVKKKDNTLRVCVDYRKLNSMVLEDCFPVPVMEDILEKLQAARIFTIMDLENGFFHVPVEEGSKAYTAFITREGLFEFNKAPFGFRNSPAAFIRFVNHIFQELVNADVMQLYMDDIIVYAVTPDECLNKTKHVLTRAAQYGLKIKWKKCSFMQSRINFLGHVIEDGKMWPGKEKTVAVSRFPIPKNVKAVQAFLGLTGFFRKFIPGYAHIARPLTNLLKKEVEFNIGPAELQSLQQLKQMLTNEPVLRIYSRDAATELHTDACKDGFGAVLLQVHESALHPVYFWSKKTSEAESRQHSYILEVKAAYLALKKFRHYLLGVHFKLVTDCVAFKQTASKKDVPREVAQWILYLQDFSFDIEHRAGDKMKHVDYLSRYPQVVMVIGTEISVRIQRAQQKDEHLKAVAEILKQHPYEGYKLKGGLLYKSVEGSELLVVPRVMETEVIQRAHEIGHFSTGKTMHAIRQQYWVPHLETKVSKFIANCIRCIIHNRKLGKQEGLLHPIDKGDTPLHTLHVDHLGPMDATSKQYKHILAVVDGFSKFVWLFPTKSTGQDEVLKKLSDWANVFGYPRRIVSDKGAAFTSNAFAEFLKEHNVEHVQSTTGVPRGNGQIERVNRTILSVIAKLSADEPSRWFKYVPQVQKAINSNMHASTQSSPFEILFGTKMNNKVEDRLLELLSEEMVTQFNEERQKIRQEAKQHIEQAQQAYKRNYDRKRRGEQGYKVGDLVAIKRTQFVAGRKLASQFLGPYEVIKAKNNGRYDVKKVSGGEGPNITSTSCDFMKLWAYVAENEELLSSGSDDENQEGRV